MGKWKKSPQQDPATIARLQTAIDQRYRDRIRQLHESAGQRSMAAGRSVGWDDVQGQIRQWLRQDGLTLPDGYDVDRDGRVVYTNKTPFLQQAAWAALPIAAVSGVEALLGLGGGAAPAASRTPGGFGIPAPPGGVPTGITPPPGSHRPPGWRLPGGGQITPQNLAALIPALMAGRGGGNTFGSPEADADFLRKAYADAQHTQGLKEARFRRVDPLHEAVTQLAFSRMPTKSVEGIALPRVPLPAGRTP